MRNLKILVGVLFLLSIMASAQVSSAQDNAAPFTKDKLDQMVAPIALYPDPLLAQIMMAATYPTEVIEANRWVKQNPNIKGDALKAALAQKPWDPSVSSLVEFPQVLGQMAKNIDWTMDLGDAFLAQQNDVMDAVQRMRGAAKAAGNLTTTPQQKVIVEQNVISIEPASPQVIYVPAYNPTVVYGPAVYYPSYYYPAVMVPPPSYVATTAVAFGVGVAVGAAAFGHWDWDDHHIYAHDVDIDVDVDRDINRDVDRDINRNTNVDKRTDWKHDPEHRKGVSYKSDDLNKRYGQQANSISKRNQDSVRGYDRPAGKTDTSQLASRAEQRGAASSGGVKDRSSSGATGGTGFKDRSSTGAAGLGRDSSSLSGQRSGSRENAFSGYGNGQFENRASDRGAASRGFERPQTSGSSGFGGGSRSSFGGGGGTRGGGGGRGGRR